MRARMRGRMGEEQAENFSSPLSTANVPLKCKCTETNDNITERYLSDLQLLSLNGAGQGNDAVAAAAAVVVFRLT